MISRTAIVLFFASLAGCSPVAMSVKAGYARTEVGGDLALDNGIGGSQAAIEQDIGSAFGLGSPQGSPFVRAQADFGAPVLTASLLWLREQGQGQLDSPFGGLPAGTEVESRLDLTIGKLTAAYDLDLGFAKVAPGVLVDVYRLDFSARELSLGTREVIDEIVFVPMPFVRAEGDVGPIKAIVEAGWLEVQSLGDSGGRFFDVEGFLEWAPTPLLNLFAGYRFIGIDASGDTGTEEFRADLEIRGWVVGGGIRF